jgi:diguanylate cyclase (GGDEF)-like protein
VADDARTPHGAGDRALRRRLDFERRLTAVSAALMRSEGDALDAAVVDALGQVGGFFQVDRAYVFEIDHAAGLQGNTHEWVAPGISSESENLQGLPLDTFPWLMRELSADRAVACADIADLPEEAVAERNEFTREGIRSIVIVPIWDGAVLSGFAGFDAVRAPIEWDEDYLIGLRLLAQMLGSALRARDMARRLRAMAFRDPLTGLANRARLAGRFDEALARAADGGGRVIVALVDLDDFKPINDRLGHAAGDAVLREVGRRLRACAGEGDTVARLGGDEFVVLVSDPRANLHEVGARLMGAFDEAFLADGAIVGLHASIGLAVAGARDDHADRLLRRADAAMYRAKAAGKHRWEVEDDGA